MDGEYSLCFSSEFVPAFNGHFEKYGVYTGLENIIILNIRIILALNFNNYVQIHYMHIHDRLRPRVIKINTSVINVNTMIDKHTHEGDKHKNEGDKHKNDCD